MLRVLPALVSSLMLTAAAGAADYRYTIQLGEPGVVLRTDRASGATALCRTTPHGVWCPPGAAECRTLLDAVDSWQAERAMPSDRQVIECLQRDRCDTRPLAPAAGKPPGLDEAALAWCLDH